MLHRCYTFPVTTCRVHSEVIQVPDLLRDITLRVFVLRDVLNEAVDLLQVGQPEFVERTETCILRRQGVVGHPSAARKLIEVILRNRRRVQVGEVDTGRLLLFVSTSCSHHHNCT